MTTRRTSAGRVITDADIQAVADEAERGYDPAELIARRSKRGRPTESAEQAPPPLNPSASIPSSTTRSRSERSRTVSPLQTSSARPCGATSTPADLTRNDGSLMSNETPTRR